MSLGVLITVIVLALVAALAAVALMRRSAARGPHGRRGLKRRFGPEYDRAVARHGGDTKAAERDLGERVKRHGSLRTKELDPTEREAYATRWAVAQERFVDNPHAAVAEADRILADLASARGFPGGDRYDEQLDALSVHYSAHVHGYRRIHAGRDGDGGTEELRAAMIEARALFDDLAGTGRTREEARHG